jgi:hypothetical protein
VWQALEGDLMATTPLGSETDTTWDGSAASASLIAIAKKIAAGSRGYSSGMVSVTRPNNTTGYTAGDVLGTGSGASAAVAAITFPTMGPAAGGEVIITSLAFERDASLIISGETTYTVHLYSVTPPSGLLDNDAWDLPSGDRASYLGRIEIGAPADVGSTLWVEVNGINKQVTLASSNLYGYVVTNGAYTPVAVAVHKIGLHGVAA